MLQSSKHKCKQPLPLALRDIEAAKAMYRSYHGDMIFSQQLLLDGDNIYSSEWHGGQDHQWEVASGSRIIVCVWGGTHLWLLVSTAPLSSSGLENGAITKRKHGWEANPEQEHWGVGITKAGAQSDISEATFDTPPQASGGLGWTWRKDEFTSILLHDLFSCIFLVQAMKYITNPDLCNQHMESSPLTRIFLSKVPHEFSIIPKVQSKDSLYSSCKQMDVSDLTFLSYFFEWNVFQVAN